MKAKHRPVGAAYINETINGVSAILFWSGERVDAISFLSADDARVFPGFKPFDTDDLAKLDGMPAHFPR